LRKTHNHHINKTIKIILRILTATIVIALLGTAAIWFTMKDNNRAFNDAVHRGEIIREELSKYYELHKKYPDSLSDLGIGNMPGKKWYGDTIINYLTTEKGYKLSFSDRFVTWDATEEEQFMAHK
jgi:type II secretory pathway pseudopilin PulG